MSQQQYNQLQGRINRYIMECKLERQMETLRRRVELIDTLWNVNDACNNRKLSCHGN